MDGVIRVDLYNVVVIGLIAVVFIFGWNWALKAAGKPQWTA